MQCPGFRMVRFVFTEALPREALLFLKILCPPEEISTQVLTVLTKRAITCLVDKENGLYLRESGRLHAGKTGIPQK